MSSIDEFNEKGYTLIPNALSEDACKIIESYAIIKEKQFMIYGDEKIDYMADWQVPNQFSVNSDPLTDALLLRLRRMVESHTGLRLFPAFSFYRVYRDGSELAPHIDRKSCEISASVCIAYNYDPEEIQWPLYMDGDPLVMKPGDIAIYKGIDVKHWREKFNVPEGIYHVQVFVHYVDADGIYSHYKFDKRKSIFHKNLGPEYNQ